MFQLIFIILTTYFILHTQAFHSKIHPDLVSKLASGGTSNIIVSYGEGTADILAANDATAFSARPEKINALVAALEARARSSQSSSLIIIQLFFRRYISFWISNQVYVENADPVLITLLAKSPSVSKIEEEVVYKVPDTQPEPSISARQSTTANAWGIDKIEAPAAWSANGGNNGVNIVVANIDTGVRYTHEALRGNYRSSYGWYDPAARSSTPNDQNGHGTHTMGTIAGSKGIGVAPGSKWIACKGCGSVNCNGNHLLSCGQWVTCPTQPNGSNKDCSKAPNLVSNSWGGGQGDTWYNDVIAAWKSAGIVPIFAIGNDGPDCSTAGSPGDQDVISVGSTNSEDALSNFSSKGPGKKDGKVKPEVSAPGASIKSASYSSDTGYSTMSGTSMACPHAAGVVAIILSAKPDIKYEEVKHHLFNGTETMPLAKTGYNCGGVSETTYPNNEYGWGRINALKSLDHTLNN